jgi:hypothetical protein
VAHGIATREKGGARGGTDRLDIELFQASAGISEFVEGRSLQFLAMPTHVGPAEIIGEEEDDMGARGLGVGVGRGKENTEAEESK